MITRAELQKILKLGLVAPDDEPDTYRVTWEGYTVERLIATVRQHERQEPRKPLKVLP